MKTWSKRNLSRHRHGTIYIAVLGVALIVGVFAAAAMQIARIELHHAVSADEMARARLAAQSGIEYAISVINGNSDWRTKYTSDDLPTARSLTGTESFTFTLSDDDDGGHLTDDQQLWVTLRSEGKSGKATSVAKVRLQPTGEGLSCLESSLHSGGILTVTSTIQATNQRISANNNINATTGSVQGNAASTGTISGTISGQPSPNVSPAWEMPDPDDVFEYYKANGKQIPVGSLVGEVLSPVLNTYSGDIDPEDGIYVMDCQWASITIMNCRIEGTLVLLNAGPGTEISNRMSVAPAIPNFPVLMVQGSLAMDWDYTSTLSIPHGTWPGGMKGLIYVKENLLVRNRTSGVDGVVIVGGTANVTSPFTLTDDRKFQNNPPPGFTSGSKMKIVPGTWKRVAY